MNLQSLFLTPARPTLRRYRARVAIRATGGPLVHRLIHND